MSIGPGIPEFDPPSPGTVSTAGQIYIIEESVCTFGTNTVVDQVQYFAISTGTIYFLVSTYLGLCPSTKRSFPLLKWKMSFVDFLFAHQVMSEAGLCGREGDLVQFIFLMDYYVGLHTFINNDLPEGKGTITPFIPNNFCHGPWGLYFSRSKTKNLLKLV